MRINEPFSTELLFPTDENIKKAANIIRNGGLVAIPTETVYGLAANALNKEAVNNIFTAKGRPQDNPLIVHIHSRTLLPQVADNIPHFAQILMDAFWPGPLSIILPKASEIPDVVTAGLDSVAVRMPSNPVALAIIKAAGVPVAAPSANASGKPSPTLASHVLADMKGRIPLIIDGGECESGVESTVLCFKYEDGKEYAVILRPGAVTAEMIETAGVPVLFDNAVLNKAKQGSKPLSPGVKYRHYAPEAKVVIVKGSKDAFTRYVRENGGDGVFAMVFQGEEEFVANAVPITFGLQSNPETQAKAFYRLLREIDQRKGKTVYVRCPEAFGVGLAVYNRLLRAAEYNIIDLNKED